MLKHHTTPEKLEKYSFLWSEARLLAAALALFLGGIPPALYFNPVPGLYNTIRSLLVIFWLVSGAAAAYLLYRWNNHKTVFGGKEKLDTYAFFVMVVSGINLGLAGLLGNNIGMSVFSNQFIFSLAALLYVASAYHLYNRWKEHGEKIF